MAQDKHTDWEIQDLHSEGHCIQVLLSKYDVELHSMKHWLIEVELHDRHLPPHCWQLPSDTKVYPDEHFTHYPA